MNCRSSIIRWQYVTIKTNNNALKECVSHLATKFPKEIADTHAFIVELEVFKSICNSIREEKPAEISKTIECAAKICSDCFHKQHLFPSVHRIFTLFRTAPSSACRSERSFSSFEGAQELLT